MLQYVVTRFLYYSILNFINLNELEQMELNSDVRQFIVYIHVHVQVSVVNGK